MQLYRVPERMRKRKLDRVLTWIYRRVSRRVFEEFIDQSSQQAMEDLLSLRK